MSTSDPGLQAVRSSPWRRLLEAAALLAVFAWLPEVLRTRLDLDLVPHPGWIAVLILGARYGRIGFLAGAAAAAAGVGLGSALSGVGPAAAWVRFGTGADLVALGAGLGISWVASAHLSREAELRLRVGSLSARVVVAEEVAAAAERRVEGLRARADRASASLSLLRDAARRLEGVDPVAAAEGAAELALVRSGASVVSIDLADRDSRRRLALRVAGGPGVPVPHDFDAAELAIPIQAGGERVGTMTVWGRRGAPFDRATAHDLTVIASWCGPAVAALRGPVRVGAIAPEAS